LWREHCETREEAAMRVFEFEKGVGNIATETSVNDVSRLREWW
jgi:hypothetical protein